MRLAAIGIILLAAAPAFAQTAAPKGEPPPEGFYRDIPNAYDLLARPQIEPNIMPINQRRVFPECPAFDALSDEQKAERKADGLSFLKLMREAERSLTPGTHYSHYRDAEGNVALCITPGKN